MEESRISWLASLYQAIDPWVTQTLKALRAFHHGFWLGVLDGDSLQAATDLKYDQWAKYQEPEYNLSGLNEWEEAVIERYFRDCKTILLGGAGGGREVVALTQRGYQVEAFECHPRLVESCQALLASQDIPAKIHLAPPNHLPENLGQYDGGFVGWGSYIHIPGRETRIQFLKEFRQHLQQGAPLLLSFFNFDPTSRHFHWVYNIAAYIRYLRFSHQKVESGDDLDGTFDHYFTEAEIQSELEAAGFEMAHFSKTPYGHAVGKAK